MKAIRNARNHQDILSHNIGTIRRANDAGLMSSTGHQNLLKQCWCNMHDVQTLGQKSVCYSLRPIQDSLSQSGSSSSQITGRQYQSRNKHNHKGQHRQLSKLYK